MEAKASCIFTHFVLSPGPSKTELRLMIIFIIDIFFSIKKWYSGVVFINLAKLGDDLPSVPPVGGQDLVTAMIRTKE